MNRPTRDFHNRRQQRLQELRHRLRYANSSTEREMIRAELSYWERH